MIENLISGISLGSVYAIIALGYTMVYGIAKMLNFAHGDVIMVGGYMSFCGTVYMGLNPWLGLLVAMGVCTILGITIEGLAYKPLRSAPSLAVLITAIGVSYLLQNSAPSLAVLITAIGVSSLLQNAAQLIWSPNPKSFTPIVTGNIKLGNVVLPKVALLTVGTCIAIMVALTLFTNKTKLGTAMRAVSEDKGAAQLMGINVNVTISTAFAIGSALAAVAGVLMLSAQPSLTPTTGSLPGIKAFTAAVLGGIGSIPGALLGGILLGVLENLSKASAVSQISDAIVFGVLILMLMVKPTGLLGKPIREKV